MTRFRRIALPLAVTGAAAASLAAFGATAEAATTLSGCTVTPLTLVPSGQFNAMGQPLYDHTVRVDCQGGRTVEIQQQRLDEDTIPRENDAVDDLVATRSPVLDFTGGAGIRFANLRQAVVVTGPNLEGNDEEDYQRVRFRVIIGAVSTQWTAWDKSPVSVVPH